MKRNLRVADFELGPHAPRVTSIQAYPEASGEDSVLMDVTIALQSPVTAIGSGSDRTLNTHFLITAFVGAPQLGGVTVPILVEQAAFEAKARVHIVLSPKAPFAKELRVSLLSKPFIDVAIRPLKLVNLMNLPILSRFILSSMDAVITQTAVTPNVVSLDLETLLTGKEVSYDVRAIGVAEIRLHESTDLRKADIMSENDTYAAISIGASRILAKSRIINNSPHPIWEETHFVLVSEDDVKIGSNLSITLFDYDVMTKDDRLGEVNIPITKLVDSTGLVSSGCLEVHAESPGRLWADVLFHPKACTKQEKEENRIECTCDDELDDNYTSGILAITVHQGLDMMVREKDKSGPYVSPYVFVFLNDRKVFQTRTKHHNPTPYWNADVELFVRDWTSTKVLVEVRDERAHEVSGCLELV
ncbi:hypothetical protein M427DRAFT_222823 [Gonapodya prolifera JEL478]|uniref:C2 domain-containing protein n=1 Tax=Gonapodya prolifera (strain JEL478) TaxID=1344416 RepID=A0A139AN15_GONPJ|nr:hypothetical protein M427DRAFT_222823 [Gonapodya prolifera JEL478]|eukprot:KXS18137.1 hypothetical protein M427DRAFT_222823 [Gonapodya prolifera JEL478]